LPRGFETTAQVARSLVQIVLYGLPDDYFTRFGPAIQAVSSAEVREAAETRVLVDRAAVAVVGDREKIGSSLLELGLGEPTELPFS
jgi:predicted Zn-dependent peptidase